MISSVKPAVLTSVYNDAMVHVQSESSNNHIVKLNINSSTLQASLGNYNERFIDVIKSLRFEWHKWKYYWYRAIDEYAAPATDRLLETAAKLLARGFDVYMPETLVSRLETGDWQPEQTHWIITVPPDGFGIRWRGKDDMLYLKAQMLPSASWDKAMRAIVVPQIYYAEVEGFAEAHGFSFTPKARYTIDNVRREYRKIILPTLPEPKTIKAPKPGQALAADLSKFLDIPGHHIRTKTTLAPYQQRGVEKLLPLRIGGLFMDMGTGKSRCAIELVVKRQQRIRRVIWFCPVTLKATVAAEIEKHTNGESVYVFDEKTDSTTIPRNAFWYIVGIESVSASDRVIVAARTIIDEDTFVIVDEASYIKGYSSLRTLRITEMSKMARYRLILTGTPISQGWQDLYSQMAFLSLDILGYGSFYAFANNHLEYSVEHKGMITRAHNVNQIAAKIEPYVYQISKADCMDLPDKLYDTVYCQLTAEQHQWYEQIKSEMLLEADEVDSYTLFLLFTYLQQIVSGYLKKADGTILELAENRTALLTDTVSRIAEDERIIIWCKYVYSVQRIARLLPDAAMYYGKLNLHQRSTALEKFRSGSRRILVATQATGGHGLTLNEARYHIFYENEFKYANRIQAEDRSHRVGQDKNVTYIDVASNSGIDSRIQDAIRRKQNVVDVFRRELKRRKEGMSIRL